MAAECLLREVSWQPDFEGEPMREDIDQGAVGWRKASASAEREECVEVGTLVSGPAVVAVRDTKADGQGPVPGFTASAWTAFLAELKDGRFAV